MNRAARPSRRPHPFVGLAAAAAALLFLGGCDPGPDNRRPGAAAVPPPSTPVPTVTAPITAGPADLFEDVTGAAGLTFVHQHCDTHVANILQSNGAGGAVLDFDGDGWMDVFLVNSGPLDGVTHHAPGTTREPNRLFRNRGNGTFEDVTDRAGLAGSGFGTTAAAGDYDNDGHPDLYVVNVGRNHLFHNRGDGTFEDVTARAGVGDPGTGIGAVFADFDNDGALDLFVANYLKFDPNYRLFFQPDGFPNALSYPPELNVLYRNRGDGTFEDRSEPAGIRLGGHRAMSVTAFDFDLDGDQDLYLSNDLSPNVLLRNDGRGHFEDVAVATGVAFNALGEAAGSMGAAIADVNGDQLPDILVTRFGYGSLYLGGPGGKGFTDGMMASGLGALTAQYVAWGAAFLDYDNDGDEDVFIANGDAHYLVGWESLLLENTGLGAFVNAADQAGAVFHAKLRGRGAAALDYDNDGRVDLLLTQLADRPLLLRNRPPTGTATHWLTLKLEGTRSNRDGFGAVVRATAAGRSTLHLARAPVAFLFQGDPRIHLGLGEASKADRIEIRWPSGQSQVLENVRADQIVSVREPGPGR